MKVWPSIGRIRWGWLLAGAVALLVLPVFTDTHTPTVLLIWALFALSLGLMWGYAGLLSFGHSAYFGLGAYTYAVAVINIGESTGPLLLAILIPAAVAAVIGAMMFYGRISDVYMGVITLVVTLILFKFMNATAGDQYAIGEARLGGFNGMPGFPVLNVPGLPEVSLFGTPMYYVAAAALLGCYLLSRWILARSFGRVLVGIRENEARCELLGYSVPAYKTAIFSISAAMAGLAGCLFANWAEIVTPGVFALKSAAEVIVWVIVGGLGTLIGPVLGAMALGMVKLLLGEQTMIDNSLILGAILVVVVLAIPRGAVPAVQGWWRGRARIRQQRKVHARPRRRLQSVQAERV
ncbi:MAG TPA: branched-chain amino acid ABC transporter permease [Burkholderiales bacterium]|nr:branched-chain amino acid ABC transporter permease [Burkholderiales bacterium]